MFLGITNIGWVLYLVVYVPLTVAALAAIGFVVRQVSKSRRVLAAILIPLALPVIAYPVAEAQYSRWQMHQACPGAPGLAIYQRVVVEGYFDEQGWGGLLPKSGYRFIEYFNDRREYERAEMAAEDTLARTKIQKPSARYWLMKPKKNVIGLHVIKNEQHILDTTTDKSIASDTTVYRTPSFIDRLWLMFFGPFESIEGCPRDYTRSLNSLSTRSEILIPIDQKQ